MSRPGNQKYSFNLVIFHETDKAWLLGRDPSDRDNDNAFWVPKSQVGQDGVTIQKNGVEWGTFEIPEWLADKVGLDVSLDGDIV